MAPTKREQFLFKMYDQMFADINQHIIVVWQSIGVVVGSIALLSLAEKDIIPIDVSISLIVILIGWMAANLIDASFWYNRNLVIIANIERQFLKQSDLKEIHNYFGANRPKNAMITHLRIQMYLGAAIGVLILTYHFYDRILPGMSVSTSNIEPIRAMPYIAAIICLLFLFRLHRRKAANYQHFIKMSPGKPVSTEGITYGPGHGFPKIKKQ